MSWQFSFCLYQGWLMSVDPLWWAGINQTYSQAALTMENLLNGPMIGSLCLIQARKPEITYQGQSRTACVMKMQCSPLGDLIAIVYLVVRSPVPYERVFYCPTLRYIMLKLPKLAFRPFDLGFHAVSAERTRRTWWYSIRKVPEVLNKRIIFEMEQ